MYTPCIQGGSSEGRSKLLQSYISSSGAPGPVKLPFPSLRCLAGRISYISPSQGHPPSPPAFSPPFHIPKPPISPPSAVFCIRAMYCRLTVFHAAIYFSIHVVKHFCSLDDNELPGDGMHLSKQWLFIF